MTLPSVRIDLSEPGRGTIHVGGHRLAGVTSLRVDAARGELPTVVLALRVLPAELAATRARVTVDDDTAAALTAMGWTPPEAP